MTVSDLAHMASKFQFEGLEPREIAFKIAEVGKKRGLGDYTVTSPGNVIRVSFKNGGVVRFENGAWGIE